MSAITVVKIGGRAFADPDVVALLAAEMAGIAPSQPIALVHGGGMEVTVRLAEVGIAARFEDGIRMTGEDEMDVVEMVLSGSVNKRLVRALTTAGARAVGISGSDASLLVGTPIHDSAGQPTCTAREVDCDPAIVRDLIGAGYLPVVASPGSDRHGAAVNINADDAALALAIALGAKRLVFLSDVPGVLAEGLRVDVLDRARAEELIEQGAVTGGMIPKLAGCLAAVEQQVSQVIIGTYEQAGDLAALFDGVRGTRIVKEW